MPSYQLYYPHPLTHIFAPSTPPTPISSGLFALFTATLLVSHVHLMLLNQSTVENMEFQAMRERESRMLGKMFRFWEIGWVFLSACFEFFSPFLFRK